MIVLKNKEAIGISMYYVKVMLDLGYWGPVCGQWLPSFFAWQRVQLSALP